MILAKTQFPAEKPVLISLRSSAFQSIIAYLKGRVSSGSVSKPKAFIVASLHPTVTSGTYKPQAYALDYFAIQCGYLKHTLNQPTPITFLKCNLYTCRRHGITASNCFVLQLESCGIDL